MKTWLLVGVIVYLWYNCKQTQTSVGMTDTSGNPIMQTCYGISGVPYSWPVSNGPCPMA